MKGTKRQTSSTSTAALYGVSRACLYRGLRQQLRPRALRRADRGQPRTMPIAQLERYREIVAAAGGQGLTSPRP